MFRPTGYSVVDYGDMIECEPRFSVYAAALRDAITPGCTVIDLGCGFGVFALLACKYGAGQVIAIEPDENIEFLRPLAQANGCADKITIVRDLSIKYTPPAPADVIVSDCRGSMPLFEHHIATIKDARERLLAPGGKLLPKRDTIRAALVRSEKLRNDVVNPWEVNKAGLDLTLGTRLSVNTVRKTIMERENLRSAPVDLAVLDYASITEPNLATDATLVATDNSQIDGILLWFDAEIAEGRFYSNAPGEPPLVYGQTYLPLANPVMLAAGDAIALRFKGNLIDGQYVWTWHWQVVRAATGEKSPLVRQSTFLGQTVDPKKLGKSRKDFVPTHNDRIAMAGECFALVGEGKTYGDIAAIMAQRHPAHLKTDSAALDFVVRLLRDHV